MRVYYALPAFLAGLLMIWPDPAQGQANFQAQGRVTNSLDSRPVEAATVLIIEERQRLQTDEDGRFQVGLSGPGPFTVRVVALGFVNYSEQVTFAAGEDFTIVLTPTRLDAGTFVAEAERDIQTIGRNTLTNEDIKNAPATFGDSINALTTLPGVIRSSGFFGPLIIRGAPEENNRYYIDDIPILNPQHFGSIQSIISNDLIARIDLYSSAFPAKYGNATAAVIDIQTLDKVDEPQYNIGVSFISADFFMARPILISPTQSSLNGLGPNLLLTAAPGQGLENTQGGPNAGAQQKGGAAQASTQAAQQQEKNRGYYITSGRVSYLTAVIPIITKAIDAGPEQLPQYYDYQLKGKYFFDDMGHHSLTLLFFGSYDTFVFVNDGLTDAERAQRRSEGADPLGDEFNVDNEVNSHAQGVYYKYEPSAKFNNTALFYSSLNWIRFDLDSISAEQQGFDRSFDTTVIPHVFGLKNKTQFDVLPGRLELNWSGLGEVYAFSANGRTQQLTQPNYAQAQPDLANDELFQSVPLDFSRQNLLLATHADFVFTYGGLKVNPGLRLDYLELSNTATLGPRGNVSYEFSTDTKLSVAGGINHGFNQTNFFLFNQPFQVDAQIAAEKDLKPTRSLHRSVAVEQGFNLFNVKVEGFYNDYFDVTEAEPDPANNRYFDSSGRSVARGFEVLLRKDRLAGQGGLSGWVSYTYTDAQFRPGAETNPWAGGVFDFEYEQPHSLKLISAYIFGMNEIGARFELYSGFPYTPVVGSQELIPGRFSQVYGQPYSQRYPVTHRLDVRYTRKSKQSWGTFNWYIEIINVYNYKAANSQAWVYNRPYKRGVNPKLEPGGGFGILPNFGLEFKF